MKVLKLYPSRIDAEIAKGFLENQDIIAVVSSDDEGGIGGVIVGLKPAKLLVADDHFDQALEILKQVEGENEE